MKSKKIVALALTAAMAISMASMTAFAATQLTVDATPLNSVATKHESKDVNSKLTEVTDTQIIGFKYEVKKDGYDTEHASAKNYDAYFEYKIANGSKVSTQSSTDTDGKVTNTTTKEFTADELTGLGGKKVDVTFGTIKSKLPTYTAIGFKHVGWNTLDQGVLTADADVSSKVLADDGDLGVSAFATGANPAASATLYPVWQKMSSDEAHKQRNDMPDFAVGKNTGDKFKEYEVKAKVAEAVIPYTTAEAELKACNAKSVDSEIFDVKAIGKSAVGGAEQEVELLDHNKIDVEIDLPAACNTDEEKARLKVFHVDSKGNVEQVKNVKIDGNKIKFRYGKFSDFVVTWDKKAKQLDSEGNPATGEASALPVALLAVAALSATGVVAYKKRKAE